MPSTQPRTAAEGVRRAAAQPWLTIHPRDFAEALTETARQKTGFTREDVHARGGRLLEEATAYGVSLMVSHVEVDPTVGLLCLDECVALSRKYRDCIDLRLAVFAQDAIYTTEGDGAEMIRLLTDACEKYADEACICAVGSAPYVDPHPERNIETVFRLAEQFDLHVQFHLDYDLDAGKRPLVHHVLEVARRYPSLRRDGSPRKVVLGHMTKLCLSSDAELQRLRDETQGLDVHIVGLPASDVYMMGRTSPRGLRPRGTVPVVELSRRGFSMSISTNNVANAFTPQGTADPLELLPFSIAVQQETTPDALHTLLQCVTEHASATVDPRPRPLVPGPGDEASFVLLQSDKACLESEWGVLSSLCTRPPMARTTVFRGRVVAQTRVESEVWSGA